MSNGPWTVEAPVFRRVGVPMEMEEVTVVPPRAGEVAVRLVASGVCHSCLHSIDGFSRGRPCPSSSATKVRASSSRSAKA